MFQLSSLQSLAATLCHFSIKRLQRKAASAAESWPQKSLGRVGNTAMEGKDLRSSLHSLRDHQERGERWWKVKMNGVETSKFYTIFDYYIFFCCSTIIFGIICVW